MLVAESNMGLEISTVEALPACCASFFSLGYSLLCLRMWKLKLLQDAPWAQQWVRTSPAAHLAPCIFRFIES